MALEVVPNTAFKSQEKRSSSRPPNDPQEEQPNAEAVTSNAPTADDEDEGRLHNNNNPAVAESYLERVKKSILDNATIQLQDICVSFCDPDAPFAPILHYATEAITITPTPLKEAGIEALIDALGLGTTPESEKTVRSQLDACWDWLRHRQIDIKGISMLVEDL